MSKDGFDVNKFAKYHVEYFGIDALKKLHLRKPFWKKNDVISTW